MNDVPDLSTLPQRMRYAAEVLDEAGERGERSKLVTPYAMWEAADLRNYASLFEAEDREAAEREALGLLLAKAFLAEYDSDSLTEQMRIVSIARKLVESGWRKADPA